MRNRIVLDPSALFLRALLAHCELVSSFGSTAFEHISAGLRFHSFTKPMDFQSLELFWLIGTFWHTK